MKHLVIAVLFVCLSSVSLRAESSPATNSTTASSVSTDIPLVPSLIPSMTVRQDGVVILDGVLEAKAIGPTQVQVTFIVPFRMPPKVDTKVPDGLLDRLDATAREMDALRLQIKQLATVMKPGTPR